MLADAARVLRLRRLPNPSATPPSEATRRSVWTCRALQLALGLHALVSVYFFATEAAHRTETNIPRLTSRPVEFFFREFRSANCYIPFESFPEPKFEIEFAGSNDGGQTWRPYEFHFKPQSEDRMSPFFAPWSSCFEAALQLAVYARPSLIERTARKLLQGEPEVVALFRGNPFPDRPPTQMRMMVFKFAFVDWATHRATARFWNKEYVGDLRPAIAIDAAGHLTEATP